MIFYLPGVLVSKAKPDIHSGSIFHFKKFQLKKFLTRMKSIFAYSVAPFLERLLCLKCLSRAICVGYL